MRAVSDGSSKGQVGPGMYGAGALAPGLLF
jgi:hypothetical protein